MGLFLGAGAQFFHNGAPLQNGKVNVYDVGTTTPKTIYTDPEMLIVSVNPAITDENGEIRVYWSGPAKIVVTTSDLTPVSTTEELFAYEGRVTAFSSRAEAEAASTGAVTAISIGDLHYQYDAAGTALTTGDGRNWSPLGTATLKHFGAVGDAVTDDTTAITAAVAYCRTNNLKLDVGGDTYVLTTASSLNISGIPEIVGTSAVIDASASTATIIMDANGTKTLLKSAQTFTYGDSTLDITGVAAGDRPARGQTLMISSIEAHPNPARTTYFKGTRTYCDAIVADELRFYPEADFDYTASAYVWKVNENVVKIHGFKMIGNAALNQAGIVLTLCQADVDVDFDYFAQACVRFEGSSGTYTGTIRYPYLINNTTNYGIGVSDLSSVAVKSADIMGTRHAVTLGGGTWAQTDSGGVSGVAAYPSTCTITGGHYGSSRTGTDYATDPSLEIGAIDCHGGAKSLVVSGAMIYGGCKLAGIESCIISGCTIYHKNYSAFEIVDSDSYDWGHIKIENNTCIFAGVPDATAVGTSDGVPRFVQVDTGVSVKRVEAIGNTWVIEQDIPADMLLGFVRGIDEIVFEGNTISANLATAGTLARMEFWARSICSVKDNTFKRVEMRFIPVNATTQDHTISGNEIIESGGSGIFTVVNPLVATDEFGTLIVDNNITKRCQFAGIHLRSSLITNAIVTGNEGIDNNASGSTTAYQDASIAIQKIADTDPLALLVMKGNTSISTAARGIYVATSATTNTDIYFTDNISHGHTTDAVNTLEVPGNTIKQQQGNSDFPDFIADTSGVLFEFNGTSWVAV